MDKEYKLIKKFINSLINENRYFLDENIKKHIEDVIDNKNGMPIRKGKIFYRGRIMGKSMRKPFPPNKMGSPPKGIKTIGRFNSYGINHLYLASDPETVVAELRPDAQSRISLAKFETVESFKILNLTDKQATADWGPMNIATLTLLLGAMIAQPVGRAEETLEYIPMQYFAELCKYKGISGIKYFSSLFMQDPNKFNLTLFSEDCLKCIGVKEIKVKNIKYKFD